MLVVLGAGRQAEEDVLQELAAADGVPLRRRRGGGGTVVLSPGQAVLALVTEVSSPFRNREYFRAINDWIREALEELGIPAALIQDRGISDLAMGERKILGTSLYRRRRILFYQGSLLVDNELTLFDRYLRFPSRVPDYRQGPGARRVLHHPGAGGLCRTGGSGHGESGAGGAGAAAGAGLTARGG